MRAFITGLTGQDGHYLSELLLSKDYEVYGLVRRTSQPKNIPSGVHVIEGDVTDPMVANLIKKISPDEVYNLAAMSFVAESFKIPRTTFEINALGTLNILEGVREIGCKFYQASTSELYGSSLPPQNETTPFHPRSPYGVSKLAAYWLTVNYRESYGLFACNGILFNHESELRGMEFVTRKVCNGVARIKLGIQDQIVLGNLDAVRDWGYAGDFVKGMHLILQQKEAGDYVLATGIPRTVKDLLTIAFKYIGIDDWTPYVIQDQMYYRPADVDCLIGDYQKAKLIGWEPQKSFESLIGEMIENEISVSH